MLRLTHVCVRLPLHEELLPLAKRQGREVSSKNASPQRFAELTAELSNCPSGAQPADKGEIQRSSASASLR